MKTSSMYKFIRSRQENAASVSIMRYTVALRTAGEIPDVKFMLAIIE
jgi:hypothetical protein